MVLSFKHQNIENNENIAIVLCVLFFDWAKTILFIKDLPWKIIAHFWLTITINGVNFKIACNLYVVLGLFEIDFGILRQLVFKYYNKLLIKIWSHIGVHLTQFLLKCARQWCGKMYHSSFRRLFAILQSPVREREEITFHLRWSLNSLYITNSTFLLFWAWIIFDQE